eukprot:jgi/Chlat1/295/Chrsp1S03165
MSTYEPKGGARSGLMETAYKTLMKRNSVYVGFIVVGALVGERVVDYGINKFWTMHNKGKFYEDIPTLGQRPAE